jgi:hypothetical protein
MICKVRSLQSRVKTRFFLQEVISSSNKVFKYSESTMPVAIKTLGNLPPETAENTDTVKQTAVSSILTQQLQGK